MNKAFTLVEVMIAIFIFVVGVVGVYSVAQTPIANTQDSISRTTAYYLAQEGVELVKNNRDTKWLSNQYGLNHICPENPPIGQECQPPWNQDLAVGDYYAYWWNGTLIAENIDAIPNLKFDYNNLFAHSGSNTIFKRIIHIGPRINDPSCGDCIDIRVTVEWTQKGKTSSISVADSINPWWSY